MIYTDRIHIISDKSIIELHYFCHDLLGLSYAWFDGHPRHPHYDFPKVHSRGIPREQLIEDSIILGAMEVTTRELIEIINKENG